MIHTVKGFGIVNKAEIDVFLELTCFFDDPVDVGNLISVSPAFSKTRLNYLLNEYDGDYTKGLRHSSCLKEYCNSVERFFF